MVYVPNYNNGNCAIVTNNETIRVYQYKPTNNSNVPYIDYYFNADYISYTGTQQFSQYSTIPTCREDITTDFWYRTDLNEILFIFLVLFLFIYILPYKLMSRLFGRWFKL